MAIRLDRGPVRAVDAAYEAASAPPPEAPGISTGPFRRVRTLVAYAGAVTAATLTAWYQNPTTGVWHRGVSTDALDPLRPGDGPEARDWEVGTNRAVLFTLSDVEPGTAGNTVTVDVVGVDAS